MDEEVIGRAEAYVASRDGHLVGRLGFGIHGIVFALGRNAHPGVSALKIHYAEEPYLREKQVYERLQQVALTEIRGSQLPQLLASNDDLLALEITVVRAPFVLDFAGAYLDSAPEFPEETWEEWFRKMEEQFGENCPAAQAILSDLQDLGIHMHDASPSNIRFA